MAKSKAQFACTECGWTTSKWVGRCGECQQWGTVVEAGFNPAARTVTALTPVTSAQPITDVSAQASVKSPTGVGELDRVLGGGLVPGVVVLLAGEPGVGKSTLLLDVAAKAAREARNAGKAPVLYVTGEESASQVRSRAERIGALDPHLLLAAEADLARVLGHIEDSKPSLLIVDSVQTIANPEIDGSAGGVAQVKAVTSALVNRAKSTDLPIVVVGHVTKDGSIAGPRVLEHLVDVVCQFEGDKHSRLRMVRAVKNRYGATDEVGCFELIDAGIRELEDPSGLFLSSRNLTVPGTCVTVTLEGRRPMPVEVQALRVPAAGPPRRTTSGVDSSRVAMMLAVLQSRLGVAYDHCDVFVSTVGGAKANEPSVDLATILALASTAADLPLAPGVVALGEVSLTGELRPVVGLQQRVNEAHRLGFSVALVPEAGDEITTPGSLTIRRISDVRSAINAVLPTH
ncbi:DNA repair protein RadA [Arcanobacterium phocisimile]|uniref:DNA repair protein RadA n=1 Tax=Arcanobacterium phocisimile TaxID=1302235 RepID=A0ABX7IH24_9ACTO|nr:DNA repair protein RadA [Arcanobacterium phocisimile]QRV02436.1 DNA repair protein RadA [Arcanobacterium phocisimile]